MRRVALVAASAVLVASGCTTTFNWGTAADPARAATEARGFGTYGMAADWAAYGEQFAAFCTQQFGFDCEAGGGRHSLAPDMSSAEAIAAFAAEQDHPQAVLADISLQLGADADARGVAAPYMIDNAGHLPADMYGANGGWTATYAAAPAFLVDVPALASRGLAPPATWTDLADPRFRGLVAMGVPVQSAMATDAVISMFVAAGGTLDAPGPALAVCRGVRSNLVQPVSLTGPLADPSSAMTALGFAHAGAGSPAPAPGAASPSPRATRTPRATKAPPSSTRGSPRPSSQASNSAAGSPSVAPSAAPLPGTSPDPFAAAGAPILVLVDARATQLAAGLGSGRAQVVIPADGGAWAAGGILINRYAAGQGDVAKAFAEWSLSPGGQAVIARSGLHPIRSLVADQGAASSASPAPPIPVPTAIDPAAYAKVKVVNVAAWRAARVGELWDGECAGTP